MVEMEGIGIERLWLEIQSRNKNWEKKMQLQVIEQFRFSSRVIG